MQTQTTLREAREDAGFTQKQLADALGVNVVTYRRIENDPSVATVSQAERICQLLSTSYLRIFFGRDDSFTSTAVTR